MMSDYLRDTLKMLLLSGLVGVVVACGAMAFYWMVEACKHFLLDMLAGYRPPQPAGGIALFTHTSNEFNRYILLVLPCLGGFVSALLVYRFAPEAKGHGTDGAIDAYHHRGGKIGAIVPLIKAIASAITIGSGGSAGKEGPISQIGAGMASVLARFFALNRKQVRILMMAGLAAGIGAIFRAPLAAALFASEVLYRSMDFDEEVIVPAIISSIIAYAIFASQFGWIPLFSMPTIMFQNPWELIPYTILAVVVSQGARFFIWLFYRVHKTFDGLVMPVYLKPMLGGLLVGIVGFWIPEALGEGYGIVQNALYGQVTLQMLAIVAVAKIITTSFTIASGGSGGVFGPIIVIGGCLGGMVGLAAEKIFPFPLNSGAFVLIGMAGFFSTSSRVPISSIIMISEITGHYMLIVPTMWVSILAFLLNRDTLFQKQLASRFDAPAKLGEMMSEILERMCVNEVFRQKSLQGLIIIKENQHVQTVIDAFMHSGQAHFPVVNAEGNFLGMIDQDEVRRLMRETSMNHVLIAADLLISTPTLTKQETLKVAIKKMITSGQEELFIVEEQRPIGLLGRRDIVDYYDRQMKVGEVTTTLQIQTKGKDGQPAEALKLSGPCYNASFVSKQEVLEFLVQKSPLKNQAERTEVLRELTAREAVESTTLGEGIAIPHARAKSLTSRYCDLIIVVAKEPVPFGSKDDNVVDIFCFVLCSDAMMHLDAMRRLTLGFTKHALAQKLRQQDDPSEIRSILGISQPKTNV